MSSSSSSNFHEVTAPEHFQALLSEDLQRVSLTNFWAPWAEPCKQMNEVVRELAKKYPNVLFLQVDAEQQTDITESFEIESVPAFIILRGHTLLSRILGADAKGLSSALETHARTPPSAPLSQTTAAPAPAPAAVSPPPADEKEGPEALQKRMAALMNQSDVVVFMKGSADVPKCGFSRKMVVLLQEKKVNFTSFDILTDQDVREGLKVLNNWPTFPQVIVKGELVGGLDVVNEMAQDEDEFESVFGAYQI
jgi:Grx4 family monothiol glutaredoxin